MKKIIIIGAVAIFCTFSAQVCAQLTVQSSGNVVAGQNLSVSGDVNAAGHMAIGTTISDKACLSIENTVPSPNVTGNIPFYGIKSTITKSSCTPSSPAHAIYGYAQSPSYSGSGYAMTGVFGYANRSYSTPTMFAAGVAGVTYYYGGIGVYGGCNGSLPSTMESNTIYAGYFDGTVNVNGTLIATTTSFTSDANSKEDICDIKPALSENIHHLRPVSYRLKQDSVWKYDKEAKELQGIHYGLVAQEVQKVFPELVYERGERLSVNYVELIPILIKEIQRLSSEIEELQNVNQSSPAYSKVLRNSGQSNTALFQNTPNPFSQSTQIAYFLPTDTREAAIHVYDMNGTEIVAFPIDTFGNGELTIDGGTLRAGMYLYSLIADGQLIDTKQMILTK